MAFASNDHRPGGVLIIHVAAFLFLFCLFLPCLILYLLLLALQLQGPSLLLLPWGCCFCCCCCHGGCCFCGCSSCSDSSTSSKFSSKGGFCWDLGNLWLRDSRFRVCSCCFCRRFFIMESVVTSQGSDQIQQLQQHPGDDKTEVWKAVGRRRHRKRSTKKNHTEDTRTPLVETGWKSTISALDLVKKRVLKKKKW